MLTITLIRSLPVTLRAKVTGPVDWRYMAEIEAYEASPLLQSIPVFSLQ